MSSFNVKEVAFQNHYGVEERTFEADGLGMVGTHKQINFMGFSVQSTMMSLPYRLGIHNVNAQDFYQMHFGFSGHEYATMEGLQLNIQKGFCNFFFLPSGIKDYLEHAPCDAYSIFEVNFSPSYIEPLLLELRESCPIFVDMALRKEASILSSESLPISYAMRAAVQEILQCKLPAPIFKVYVEAKVQELLALMISQIKQQKSHSCNLHHQDIDKLHSVKELLLSDTRAMPTLKELSLSSGLNIDKLKKGFKSLFGNTVFGYLNELKMQEAKRMLLETNLPIAEIAECIGYKNAQHFTAAYKKKYGYLPKHSRKFN